MTKKEKIQTVIVWAIAVLLVAGYCLSGVGNITLVEHEEKTSWRNEQSLTEENDSETVSADAQAQPDIEE